MNFIRIDGDIILGGLFLVYGRGLEGKVCGEFKKEKGIYRLEVMFFVLDRINNDLDLLFNITLGVRILDICFRDIYVFEQSLIFVQAFIEKDGIEVRCGSGGLFIIIKFECVVGVIGALGSSVFIMVVNIFRFFKVSV